ncbi:unnamed protein product [Rhizophagus irregularis]|nr:unnamed protein product [Rhizophagus irregularis]
MGHKVADFPLVQIDSYTLSSVLFLSSLRKASLYMRYLLGALDLSLSSDLLFKISSTVSSGGNGTLKSGILYLVDFLTFIFKYYQNEGKRIRTLKIKWGKPVVFIFIFKLALSFSLSFGS